jgi:hypothetical protein
MGNQVQFTVIGVAEATGELKAAMLLGCSRGLELVGQRGKEVFAQHAPVGATGALSQGIVAEFHQDAESMHETLTDTPPADAYAAAVETGTAPHFPPSEALLLWVKKKLGVSNDKDAKAVAFLVARAISKRGTPGAHMFDATLEQLGREAPSILEAEVAKACAAAGFSDRGQM